MHGNDQSLTTPNRPGTNGQVDSMNYAIKDATVQRYHYDRHDELRTHPGDFIAAYNFVERLKTLGAGRPTSSSVNAGRKNPIDLLVDPTHQMMGINI